MAEQMVERVTDIIAAGIAEDLPSHSIACAAIEAMRPDASTMGLILKLAKKTGLDPSEIDIAVCFYLDAALKP